jgi:prepilin-type N-terminal cleavage/methylation domain-containing protein
MKQNGFTILELIIVVILITCVLVLVSKCTSLQIGPNGINSEMCIAGYKHSASSNGSTRQIFDNQGKGIECQ